MAEFIQRALAGVSLDDPDSANDKRPDFLCLGGRLVIELKTLAEDGSDRMDNLTDELRQRDDWPMFLGSAPMQAFIQNTRDPEGVQRRVLERLGRGIINHLKKANRQLEAHSKTSSTKNLARMLLLVNENHEAYDPHTVSYILWHAIRQMKDATLRYEHVDLIVYITERHAQVREGRVAFPTIIIEGASCETDEWKGQFGGFFVARWARWNGHSLEAGADVSDFETIDHVPDQASRKDFWKLEYRRNPYLRGLTEAQLYDRFDEVTLINSLSFLKDCPIEIAADARTYGVHMFSDMMDEMAHRAIPVTRFPHKADRAIAAGHRLKLPTAVLRWIEQFERDIEARNNRRGD
ncbi:hypothetical protein [Sphingomonas oryzagri]